MTWLSRRPDLWLALALFAAALALRLGIAAAYRFDGLYGQDAYANYDYGAALVAAAHGEPAPGPFFWPLGYPLLLAGSFALLGVSAGVGQAVSLLMGAAAAALVFALARTMGATRVGALVAGSAVVICGQAVQSSLVVMSDIPALVCACASALALWVFRRNRHERWLALGAFLLAWAGITRWLYLLLVAPWALALLTMHPPPRVRSLLAAVAVFAAVLLPQLAVNLTGPYPATGHNWLTGWSPANAFERSFSNVDGHFTYDRINAVYYAGALTDAYFLPGVLLPFCAVGLARLLRRGRAAALMLGGWLLLPYLFLAGIPYQNIRFMLIMTPPVAVLAGFGVDGLWQWLRHRPRLRIGLLIAVLVSAGVLSAGASATTLDRFVSAQARDAETAAWVASVVPSGATVYAFDITLRLRHSSDLKVHELFYETPQSLERALASGEPAYLVVNGWALEHQWQGHAVQAAYHWLRDVRGLTPLGQYGYFQLYKVLP